MGQELISMLEAYGRRWPEEAHTVRQFLDFVAANPACFDRELEIGHVTGSAWLVDREEEQVLLTHHKKLNRWLQLGGHADGCSDVLAVALREVAEESGITSVEAWSPDIFDIDIHLIPERHGVKAHHHYDVRFALRVLGEESYVVSEESHDLAWIEIATIENFTDEHSILRMARKWKGRTTQRGHDLNARGIQASDSSINGFNGS